MTKANTIKSEPLGLDTGTRVAESVPEVGSPRPAQLLDPASFNRAWSQLAGALKRLNYQALRPGQDKAVHNLLRKKDTIALLPTSMGKSAIYIIPTLCHNWKCVIFSPLVSLMQDQLEGLQRYDLPAAQISSGQGLAENQMALRMWESGDLQFLLVAPERQNAEEFMRVMRLRPPNLVAVDEAHSVSQWGHNFRPAYSRVGGFIAALNPDTVLCLTATATEDVEEDIRQILGIPHAHRVIYYPKRDNLLFSSRDYTDAYAIRNFIRDHPGPTIVYCGTQRHCEELYARIGPDIEGGALVYHGGMDSNSRTSNQELFMSNHIRVMFCTNAFGMGVNKPDIRNVLHRDMPPSVEAYTQESGRGGRDGQPCQCVLFVDPQSIITSRWMIDQEFPGRQVVERVFHYLEKVKDKQGVISMTVEKIAEAMHMDSRPVGSALATLEVAKVVARFKEAESDAMVKLVREEHEDPALQLYLDTVRKIGYPVAGVPGAFELKLSVFVAQTKLKITKVKETFKLLEKNGYLQFTPPFAGKTTKVIGTIDQVDFDKLAARYRDKLRKLDEMQDYADTEDQLKADFLQDYFTPTKKA